MPDQKPKPVAPEDKADNSSIENRTGHQQDDNIDDLGRDLNKPNSKPIDQPTGRTKGKSAGKTT
jgi:hypothetical protein